MILEDHGIEIRTAEEDFEKVRMLLNKEDYPAACEQLQEIEGIYETDLWGFGSASFRREFWKLMLEAHTYRYSQYELDEDSQREVWRCLRNLKEDGKISLRVVRYLKERTDYLRWKKRIDFEQERKKMALHVGLAGFGLLLAVWLFTFSIPMTDWMEGWTANVIFTALAIGYVILIGVESYVCIEKYKILRNFLYHPAPFENME